MHCSTADYDVPIKGNDIHVYLLTGKGVLNILRKKMKDRECFIQKIIYVCIKVNLTLLTYMSKKHLLSSCQLESIFKLPVSKFHLGQ